ncbi:MAG: DNA repair protein RecN [Clostridiales Family XIII bacterium]|jgi:DNA repair protein RecN (Recombination protein N)|nr:DNA repair protein RecN [Clostridiales Family XIII bacterium]
MINALQIRNFAIIKELEVAFQPGLAVITGETGAGKSVVIEAMSLALGSRADKSMVRTGSDMAVVSLLIDPETILRREVSAHGKSVCKIDGEIATLGQMAAVTAGQVDIHGQYDHQSLLVTEKHIGLLDAYGHEYTAEALEKTAEAFSSFRTAKLALSDAAAKGAASGRELDFLRYEIDEIDAARLVPGEDAEIEARVKIMQSSEKIYESLLRVYGLLSGGDGEQVSALSLSGGVRDGLAGLTSYGSEFEQMAGAGADVYFTLEELEGNVRAALERMDFKQSDLDAALSRLDQLDRMKRKYGGSIDAALAHRDKAAARISGAENRGAMMTELKKALADAEARYITEAGMLSGIRRAVAAKLERAITEQLDELNFKEARFAVSIDTDEGARAENGFDRIEFMLSANKGQPLLPLAKVASGGELSRIMLAFKSVTGDFDGIETMVFDEIDSGISGVTASIVGEKLLRMAANHQIICITHLPQIAAFADHHYLLEKSTSDSETFTTLKEIEGAARIDELARLLGGRNVTDTARENARELIALARGE